MKNIIKTVLSVLMCITCILLPNNVDADTSYTTSLNNGFYIYTGADISQDDTATNYVKQTDVEFNTPTDIKFVYVSSGQKSYISYNSSTNNISYDDTLPISVGGSANGLNIIGNIPCKATFTYQQSSVDINIIIPNSFYRYVGEGDYTSDNSDNFTNILFLTQGSAKECFFFDNLTDRNLLTADDITPSDNSIHVAAGSGSTISFVADQEGIYSLSYTKNSTTYTMCVAVEGGGDGGNADLVIENTKFVRIEDNGYVIYRPMNMVGFSINEIEAIAGTNKNLIVNAVMEQNNQTDYLFYKDGYNYLADLDVIFELYSCPDDLEGELTFSNLTKLDFVTNNSIDVDFPLLYGDEDYINENDPVSLYEYKNNSYSCYGEYEIIPEVDEESPGNIIGYVKVKFTKSGKLSYVKPSGREPIPEGDPASSSSSVQNPFTTIFGDSGLQAELEKLRFTTGNTIYLKGMNDSTSITYKLYGESINCPALVIRNFGSITGDSFINDNAQNDICINLQGATLDLGNNFFDIEANSKVHIKNGTIKGSGASLIRNYGILTLENIYIDYKGSGAAVNSYGGFFNFDEYSTIVSTNIGYMSCPKTSGNLNDTSANVLMGTIKATNDALVINNPSNLREYQLRILGSDQNVPKTNTGNPTPSIISENGYAINATGKTEVRINGSTLNGTDDLVPAVISGSKAIKVNGGELIIGSPCTITSTSTSGSLIEVDSSNTDVTQNIQINVNVKNISTTNGFLIEEIKAGGILNKITINHGGNSNECKFTYGGKIGETVVPFKFIDSNPVKKIFGGNFSSDIKSYLSSEYTTVKDSEYTGYYKVITAGDIPSSYDFKGNDTIEDLRSYLENIATTTINIKKDVIAESNETFVISGVKNINLNGFKLQNIQFIINEDEASSQVFFLGNDPSKEKYARVDNVGNFIHLINGEAYLTRMDIFCSSNTEYAAIVESGRLNLNDTASLTAPKGVYVDAPNGARYYVNGVMNCKEAINVIRNNRNDYNGIWIEKDGDLNKYPSIEGTISVAQGFVLVRNGTVDSSSVEGSSAITVYENGLVNFERGSNAIGSAAAVTISDNASADVKGAYLTGYNTIVINYSNNCNPSLQVLDKSHLATTDKNSGTILKVNGTNYLTNTGFTKINANIDSGFLNLPVDEKQFRNLNYYRSVSNQNIMTTCIQYLTLIADYPYTIVNKKQGTNNSVVVNEGYDSDISADQEHLQEMKKDLDESEWAVMIANKLVTVPAEYETINNVDDVYDISVNNIKNKNVKNITEVDQYQFITLTVKDEQGNGLAKQARLYHKHGKEKINKFTKVNKARGEAMKTDPSKCQECYYVQDDYHIVVVTRKFSIFGTGIEENEIATGQNEIVTVGGHDIELNVTAEVGGTESTKTKVDSTGIINSISDTITNASSDVKYVNGSGVDITATLKSFFTNHAGNDLDIKSVVEVSSVEASKQNTIASSLKLASISYLAKI